MENKELNLKPQLEIIRFDNNDIFKKSLDDHELPMVGA